MGQDEFSLLRSVYPAGWEEEVEEDDDEEEESVRGRGYTWTMLVVGQLCRCDGDAQNI